MLSYRGPDVEGTYSVETVATLFKTQTAPQWAVALSSARLEMGRTPWSGARPLPGFRWGGPHWSGAIYGTHRERAPVRAARKKQKLIRPQIRRDYPLNLSILLGGGKETNKDSLSSGERTGRSPARNPARRRSGRCRVWEAPLSRGAVRRVQVSLERGHSP